MHYRELFSLPLLDYHLALSNALSHHSLRVPGNVIQQSSGEMQHRCVWSVCWLIDNISAGSLRGNCLQMSRTESHVAVMTIRSALNFPFCILVRNSDSLIGIYIFWNKYAKHIPDYQVLLLKSAIFKDFFLMQS